MSVGESEYPLLFHGYFLRSNTVTSECHQLSSKELNLVILAQLNALRTHC